MNLIKEIMLAESGNSLIDRLKEFVSGCSYLCHKQSIERVQAYINADCDYSRTLEDTSADANNFRNTIAYANGKLKNLLGKNILRRIKETPEFAEELITWVIEHPQDLVYNQVLDFVPAFKGKRFNWEDCKEEIKFLHTYTYLKMKRSANKLEPQKIAYIYHVLTEPSDVDMEFSLALRKNFTYSA